MCPLIGQFRVGDWRLPSAGVGTLFLEGPDSEYISFAVHVASVTTSPPDPRSTEAIPSCKQTGVAVSSETLFIKIGTEPNLAYGQ